MLIDYRPALRERSGVGEYVFQLTRALLRAYPPESSPRLDLTLFSSSWKDRLNRDDEIAGAAIVDRRIPVSLLNAAWHRLEWPPAETLAGRAFDVAHSPHPLLLPCRSAAAVVTIHDLDFLTHPERTSGEVRRDYASLARDHAHRADRIIVPSQATSRAVCRHLDVAADRISICPHGRPAWAPRTALPADGYVLFVGTLEPRKNIGVLLDAYERLLDRTVATHRPLPTLILAGRETQAAAPWIARLAKAPLHGVVQHIGYVDPLRRRKLYDGARLLVLPSFDEGFGLPVLEAMTVGVPVVAADRGALPEVLGGAGLLVDPEDADQLASAIERLLTDDTAAAQCAARGVARSRQFDWAHTAGCVYAAYERAREHRQCASA